MKAFEEMMKRVQNLKANELRLLSEEILRLLLKGDTEFFSASTDTTVSECRKCGSEAVVKFGKDKNGHQRYKCNSCGTLFCSTSYSVVSGTRHSLETWKKYIELLLASKSLEKCAEACDISVRTAFIWRHKILSALQNDQNGRVLSGIIETDDTYISISYKGNHKKSRSFVMPRAPYKRGTDSRSQIGSRACVMCALERNGQVYGEVLGKGQPTIAMLKHAFDERISPESVVLSDKAVGIRNYFERNKDIELVQLMAHVRPKSMGSPPEVKGAFHIQNINNLHARFRRFMYVYNGVSTKYLNHYLNLFVWIENHKKLNDLSIDDELFSLMITPGSYVKAKDFSSMPAIPSIA